MPRGDRTGPMGAGSMTGRGAGYCAGYDRPGFSNPYSGRGYRTAYGTGRGAAWGGFGGRGRGWRNMYYATGLPGWIRFGSLAPVRDYPTTYAESDPQTEKQALQNQADMLKSELDLINKRLDEIESSSSK